MPHSLDVTAVMPAEIVALTFLDHETERFDPVWVLQALKACLLCALYIAEYVPSLKCVAARADGTFEFDELSANWAVFSGYTVGIPGHLGRFTELAGHCLRALQRDEHHNVPSVSYP